MLKRLASLCYRHRGIVVVSWVVLLVALFAVGSTVGTGFTTDFSALPGTDSQKALDILEEGGFDSRTGTQAQIVFEAEGAEGVNDPAVRSAMEAFFAEVEATTEGASVESPYEPGNEFQVSEGGTIAYAELNISDRPFEEFVDAADAIKALAAEQNFAGATVEFGGDMFTEASEPSSEIYGIIGAIIILLIAFGSVLAMGLPIVTALMGVGAGVALITLSTRFLDMPDFTTAVAAMVGIGVGIDYALLIVTRYRGALHNGMSPHDSVVLAMNTAGRSTLFAGITVFISLLGMMFIGIDTFRGVGVGTALAVLMTMLAALTLLPAVLAFVGTRIDRWSLPNLRRHEGGGETSVWYRWSRLVQRYPIWAAVAGAAVLLVLAIPVLTMRLGFADAGNRPESDTTRRAYDLLSEGFGPGFNGPFMISAETPAGSSDFEVLDGLVQDLRQTPGVAFVADPIPNENGTAAIVQVIPTTAPQDEETEDLVHELRDNVIPAATTSLSGEIALGGVTPASVDFAEYTWERMPIFIGAVLALSFLLLMVVFRSVLVPLKAVVMNLLSIGAAYGVIVAIFQWGWGLELFGGGKEGPIEAWAPIMLFAVVFGLSMDYEVFLLSRIREEYDKTGDNSIAVADGLATTARVITAAAAIMVVVFGSFVLGDDRALKVVGLGLAVAVFLDATVVRLVLVPATMELLGRLNWWFPKWLDRVTPRVHVEAEPDAMAAPAGRRPLAGGEPGA